MVRSRDPPGQFQGLIIGQKVKLLKYAPIVLMIPDFESVLDSLDNYNYFVIIVPIVSEMCVQRKVALPHFAELIKIW